MATLVSPGVSVSVSDESFYSPAGAGSVPLIVIATAQDKFFSSILGRSGVDFHLVLVDFSSIYTRAVCDEGTKAESQKRIA